MITEWTRNKWFVAAAIAEHVTPIDIETIAKRAEIEDVRPNLRDLCELKYVRDHGTRYSLTALGHAWVASNALLMWDHGQ